MPTPKRVILLACSEKKRAIRGPAPAFQVYDGPLWSTLRKQFGVNAARGRGAQLLYPDVLVLSAKYGFIKTSTPISHYDERLTELRAIEISEDPVTAGFLRYHTCVADEVFLVGGRLYRTTMQLSLNQAGFAGKVLIPTPARGIGDIRAALISYLEEGPVLHPVQFNLKFA